MENNIFIDIDGTLCDFNGVVPDSAITAIKAARENGHKVLLCTGRAKSEIYPFILEIGFDGLVCSAGAYVECDNKVIFHKSIEEDKIKMLIDSLQKDKIPFILETNQGVFIKKEDAKVLQDIFMAGRKAMNIDANEFVKILNEVDDISKINKVNKVLFFQAKKSIEQMQEELKEHFLILPNSIGVFGRYSGEISDKNINKSTGIQKVLEYYGKTKETVIAFGDGANDMEMLEFAHIGIAMGNAWEYLKKRADDITDSVSENGIYNSFKKYKLIT